MTFFKRVQSELCNTMRPTSHTESWNSPVSLQLYYPYFLSFFSSLAYMGCLCSHWSSTLLTWLFHSSKMTSTSIKWSIVFAFLSAKRNVTELLGLLKGALHNLRKIIVFNGSQGCGGNCSQDSVACTCTQLTLSLARTVIRCTIECTSFPLASTWLSICCFPLSPQCGFGLLSRVDHVFAAQSATFVRLWVKCDCV